MINYSIMELLWIFIMFSFAGWCMETVSAATKSKRFVNRGFFFGPFCPVYGIAAVSMILVLWELKENLFFLFIGCCIIASFIEWTVGHLLETIYHKKWWDYSGNKGNIDGYICLKYSVIWGVLGVLTIHVFAPLTVWFYQWIPDMIGLVLVIVIGSICALDGITSIAAAFGVRHRIKNIDLFAGELQSVTKRLGKWITQYVQKKTQKAYPAISEITKEDVKKREKETDRFAAGCGFYKLVCLFFIGAFLGDITETVFCYITTGVIMSRSSVVYGPFSIVWGLAIVLATAILHRFQGKSDGYIFAFGAVLGGAYEYVCSVFTEIVFGTVFWDYSGIPFNLGGRINLLYCFFWGIAAVVWIKVLYPKLSKWIEKIPITFGKIVVWIAVVFMVFNMGMSALAMGRYSARQTGEAAQTGLEVWLDQHFDDVRMDRIYPNAIITGE